MEGEEARRGKEALSGGNLCHVCGYQYPNANPSAKLRRSHRKNCGKTLGTPEKDAGAGADEREEEEEHAVERNAGEGVMPGSRGGGGGGESEGNGGMGEAIAFSASLGSARGDTDSVEVREKESAEHASPNVAGVQVITDSCSEACLINRTSDFDEITREVGRPAEREDSLDEYQDASPFLHQSDSEVGAAAEKSDFSVEEIKNLDSFLSGVSVAANEISVETDGVRKDQSSGQPNMIDLSGESKVGKEVGCYSDNRAPGLAEPTVKLESSDGSSVNIHSDNTDMVDSKPDKTSDHSEFIGDVNSSTPLISDLESQSTRPRKVESLMEDSMDALHIISEVSPSSEEKAGSGNVESETENNSRIDFVQTEDELKLSNAVNTSTDCSSQYKHLKDALDVQLPVENSCLGNSVCSLDGHQSDHVVTIMDSLWSSDEDICSEGIKVKGNELGFSCEERPQYVEQLDDIADGNPFVENPNGFTEDQVYSKEIGPKVPTIDQVSASREHVALLMNQMSTKNPFIQDDTRSDDLFELATESYQSEAPNVVESKLQIDFTPQPLDQLTVSDQINIAEGQHSVISDDRILAISSTCGNGPVVGTEDVSVSSTSDPTKNISFVDASVNHSMQEDGEHTSGINFVPSQVLPAEFSTMPTSQDINALKTDDNEKMPPEDISTKDMTASLSVNNVEEKKETEGTSVKEMDSMPKADTVEEEKLTGGTSAEVNAVWHAEDAGKKQADDTVSRETSALQNLEEREQTEDTAAKGVCAVGSMENADVDNQTEDTGAEEMKPELKTDNADGKKQTNDTSTEETNEKKQAQDTCSKDTGTMQSTANAEDKKHTEDPVVVGQEGNKQNEDISLTVAKQDSERVHVPLKVLLAEASVETKEKKTTAKERVLSFRRRVSKDDSSAKSPKSGADDKYWSSPARLPENNAEKKSKARKQPWMPFICCHSVH